MSTEQELLEQQLLSNAITGRKRINILLDLWQMIHGTDSQRAVEIAIEALHISQSIHSQSDVGKSLYAIGYSYYTLEHYDQALDYLERSIDISAHDDNGRANALKVMGQIYRALEEPVTCYHYLMQSLSLYEKTNNPSEIASVNSALGALYMGVREFAQSFDYYKKSLEAYEQLGQRTKIRATLHNIGILHHKMGDNSAAREYLDRALSFTIEEDDQYSASMTRILIGWISIDLGQLSEALRYVECAYGFGQTAGNKQLEAMTTMLMGIVLKRQGRLSEAQDYLKRTLNFTVESMENLHIGINIMLGEILCQMGDTTEGLNLMGKAWQKAKEVGHDYWESRTCAALSRTLEHQGDAAGALFHYKRCMELSGELCFFDEQGEDAVFAYMLRVGDEGKREEMLRMKAVELEQLVSRKQQELTASALAFMETNQLIDEVQQQLQNLMAVLPKHLQGVLKELINRVQSHHNFKKNWDAFEHRFHETHPGFVRVLTERHPGLTPAELRVCSLLRIDLSSKEIAGVLSVTPKSVDIYRYRIRKKFGLTPDANLTSYLASL